MILLCPQEKSTQFHYPLDPKKIRAEGSIHKDTTYQGSDRQDFYRHGKKKKKKTKKKKKKKTNKLNQEPMTRSLQLPYWAYVTAFLQTDLFLDYLFRKKTKAVPVQWPYDVRLVSCDWSSGSCGSLIRGKFNLKINRSVKTPWHEHNGVVGSGSWVPD